MLEVILVLLGAFLAYLFGRWQGEHQLLYERRVGVIEELSKRFEAMDRQFSALFAPLGGGDPAKAKEAADSFDALQTYFRQNSLWLPLRVKNQVGDFLVEYREPFFKFTDEAMVQDQEIRGSERIRTWNEVWTKFRKDSPRILQTLETEFRAALGSWRAWLTIVLEYLPSSRRNQES